MGYLDQWMGGATPEDQLAGLLGRWGHERGGVAQPPAAVRMPPPPLDGPKHPRLEKLGAFLNDAGAHLQGGQADELARFGRGQRESDLRRQIITTVSDPRELAVALADPLGWARRNAPRFGYLGTGGEEP
jgi:hypothetical protein